MATALRHDLEAEMLALGARARSAARVLATSAARGQGRVLAGRCRDACAPGRTRSWHANAARHGGGAASAASRGLLLDRLALDAKRVEAMAAGARGGRGAARPGRHRARRAGPRPNGLDIARVRVPLGVIGIIYESRAERHRRRRRALPQGRQCRDPARRLGELPFLARDPRGLQRAACARPGCRRPRSSCCRPRDRAAVGHRCCGMSEHIDVIVPRGGRVADRAGAAREPHPGDRPSRRHLPHLCRTPRPIPAMARAHRAQRQDAAHRRLRRDRDPAGRPRASPATLLPPILADLLAAGCEIRGDAAVPRDRSARRCRRPKTIGAPNISTRSWRCAWSTGSTGRSRISTATARTTPTRSSPRTRPPPSASCARSTAPSCCTTPRPSSPMAASSAWAPRSASRPDACTPRGPVGAEQLTSYKYVVRGSGQVRP